MHIQQCVMYNIFKKELFEGCNTVFIFINTNIIKVLLFSFHVPMNLPCATPSMCAPYWILLVQRLKIKAISQRIYVQVQIHISPLKPLTILLSKHIFRKT